MEKKCNKCGTTENVNFLGMCKRCYEESIVIHEKTEEISANIPISEKVKKVAKQRYAFIECGLLALVIILFVAFQSKTQEYYELQDENSNLTTKYMSSQTELKETSSKYKNELSELKTKVTELEQTEKQAKINSNITTLESKITELTTQKEKLQAEVDFLNGEVVKIKGEPKTYPAGHLTVGMDVPTGKYKIYDGRSNFVVRSIIGKLEVNIILGGNYGVDEYIYTFKTGDKIEADSSFKLVEVQ